MAAACLWHSFLSAELHLTPSERADLDSVVVGAVVVVAIGLVVVVGVVVVVDGGGATTAPVAVAEAHNGRAPSMHLR